MNALHAVLLPIAGDDRAGRPQSLQRQRRAAREALNECAHHRGLSPMDWRQDANRVPLPCGPYHWSISHKPGMAAAVIDTGPVGIDVERLAARRNTDLWQRVANPDEWAVLGEATWEAFYRIWTAKEAVLKANSRGIGHLERCRLVDRLGPDVLLLHYESRPWPVRQARFDDHLAAVTLRGPDQPVKWHHGGVTL